MGVKEIVYFWEYLDRKQNVEYNVSWFLVKNQANYNFLQKYILFCLYDDLSFFSQAVKYVFVKM